MELLEHYTSAAETYAGVDGDLELVFHVKDAPSGYDARNFVLANTWSIDPSTQLVRKTVVTTPKGANWYECKVKYSKIENKIKMDVDCTAEKIHLSRSIENVGNWKVRNLTSTTVLLASTVNTGDTTIEVTDASSLPDFPFVLMLDSEMVLVTDSDAGDDNTLVVTRGYGGTTISSHTTGGTLLAPGPDFGGLIGVDKDSVKGVDWWAPAMKLTLQWSSKWGTLDSGYVEMCEENGGAINDEEIAFTFKGQEYHFLRGELVFLGGTFSDTSDDGASITLKFEVSRNADISIGERDGSNSTNLAKIFKYGWDYGWVRTVQTQNQGVKVEVPDSFHVERVAEFFDFSQFGVFDTISSQEETWDALQAEEAAEEG